MVLIITLSRTPPHRTHAPLPCRWFSSCPLQRGIVSVGGTHNLS